MPTQPSLLAAAAVATALTSAACSATQAHMTAATRSESAGPIGYSALFLQDPAQSSMVRVFEADTKAAGITTLAFTSANGAGHRHPQPRRRGHPPPRGHSRRCERGATRPARHLQGDPSGDAGARAERPEDKHQPPGEQQADLHWLLHLPRHPAARRRDGPGNPQRHVPDHRARSPHRLHHLLVSCITSAEVQV